jgi:hypothetical protein
MAFCTQKKEPIRELFLVYFFKGLSLKRLTKGLGGVWGG